MDDLYTVAQGNKAVVADSIGHSGVVHGCADPHLSRFIGHRALSSRIEWVSARRAGPADAHVATSAIWLDL